MLDKFEKDVESGRTLNRDGTSDKYKIKKLRVKLKGLTVGDLMMKLSYFKKDMKVILTDINGNAYPAIQVVQDTNRSVLIF